LQVVDATVIGEASVFAFFEGGDGSVLAEERCAVFDELGKGAPSS